MRTVAAMSEQAPFPSPPERPTPESVEAFLEAVVLHYVLASEEGLQPDIDAYLVRYPRHAENLALLLGQEGGRPSPEGDPSTESRIRRRGWPVNRYGRFEILFHVASTGGSHVYKARDDESGDVVALKVVKLAESIDPREIKRFQREALMLVEVDLPHVIHLVELGEAADGWYMAMPWIDGMTLQELIEVMRGERPPDPLDPARLTVKDRVAIIRTLALTLDRVHARGIFHRDLKPSNVMLGVDLEPVLIDFGIARNTEFSRVTRTADAPLGTPRYLAPELLLGDAKTADVRTDVYGLGMIAYEFLSGMTAYPAANREDLFSRIMEGAVMPLARAAPTLPKPVVRVVSRAIEHEASRRWQTMAAFAEALDRAISGGSVGRRLIDAVLRRGRP